MNPRDRGAFMWEHAFEMLEQADRLHRHFFQLDRQRTAEPTWEPPVDVLETARHLVIVVALPGVPVERLQVVAANGTLSVVGERPMPVLAGAALKRLEIPYGRFERRIDLPAGHYDIEERTLADGCLRLVLRKR